MDDNPTGHARRVTVGIEQNRLTMLLAILHRHGGIAIYDKDVFVNIVGGVSLKETGADLAVLLAAYSSFRDQALDRNLIVFGEVGLTGEIRPVYNGVSRLKEAKEHGFKKAIIPNANKPKENIPGLEIIAVDKLSEAIEKAL